MPTTLGTCNCISALVQWPLVLMLIVTYSYAKFGASWEEVEESAKAAQLHNHVMSFPDNYETMVGERGIRLSRGEKQHVAIAHTLLKNPPMLLLDEATRSVHIQQWRIDGWLRCRYQCSRHFYRMWYPESSTEPCSWSFIIVYCPPAFGKSISVSGAQHLICLAYYRPLPMWICKLPPDQIH